MYFWFFQARENHEIAPLTAWFSGGPGVPSSSAALGEHGPCSVLSDSKTTELNPWSWNEKVNMIYLDQPLQVGYSYDTLVNGTLDEVASPFQYRPSNFSNGIPETNLTFLTGTFPSGSFANTPNTSMAAAPFIWQLMQVWMQEYVPPTIQIVQNLHFARSPVYKPAENRLSIWGQSYGGHYGPVYANYFEQQNERIANGSLGGSAVPIHIDTVGLINACIDIDVQMIYYPKYAHNNTYGLELITEEDYASAVAASPACKNMTATCRDLAAAKDPNGVGNNADVNKACKGAFDYCFANMHDFYNKNGVSPGTFFCDVYLTRNSETSMILPDPPLPNPSLPSGPPATSTMPRRSKR
jgi:carboxypeptidase C (cathepsin A)